MSPARHEAVAHPNGWATASRLATTRRVLAQRPPRGRLGFDETEPFRAVRAPRSQRMSPQVDAVVTRPRVEGLRATEILEATLEVLSDVGYDRLTMDAVALRAKA